MLFCKKAISPFQRKFIRQATSMLGACIAISAGFPALFDSQHLSPATKSLVGMLAVIPIVGFMIVIARYLARETDEFLRSLVVQAILWGFGTVMVADTLLASLIQYSQFRLPFGLLNMDLLIVTAIIAMRIQLWRHQ